MMARSNSSTLAIRAINCALSVCKGFIPNTSLIQLK
jgi:hypothetical protein